MIGSPEEKRAHAYPVPMEGYPAIPLLGGVFPPLLPRPPPEPVVAFKMSLLNRELAEVREGLYMCVRREREVEAERLDPPAFSFPPPLSLSLSLSLCVIKFPNPIPITVHC